MPLQLPTMKMPNRAERGRNPYEGYQRGWGLAFGGLFEQMKTDEIFMRAARLASARTVVTADKLANLYLLIRFFLGKLDSQDIIEFGSFRGGSAFFMASILKDLFPKARLYALDTYEGMPETGDMDWHKKGDFAQTDLTEIQAAAKAAGLDNIEFVKGLFQVTFPGVASNVASFGLAHIDCDILSGVQYCQNAVWPKMCAGGYVVFDDALTASCLGAMEAVENLIMTRGLHSEQVSPHFVFRAGLQ
jgi:predicted O-methyltransferase YrrM